MSKIASILVKNWRLIAILLLCAGLFYVGATTLDPDSEYILFVNIGCAFLACIPFYLVTKQEWTVSESLSLAGVAASLLVSGNHLYKTSIIISTFQDLYDIHALLIPVLAIAVCCLYIFLVNIIASIARWTREHKKNADRPVVETSENRQRLGEAEVATCGGRVGAAFESAGRDSRPIREPGVLRTPTIQRSSASLVVSRIVQFAIILAAIGVTIYIVFKVLSGYQMIDIDVVSTLIWIISIAVVTLITLLALGAVVIVCFEMTRFITRKLSSIVRTPDQPEENGGIRQYLKSSPIRMYYLSVGIVVFVYWAITYTTPFNLDDLYNLTLSNDYLALPVMLLIGTLVFLIFVQIINTIITYTLDEERNHGFRNEIRGVCSQAVYCILGSIKGIFSFIDLAPDFVNQWRFLLMGEDEDDEEAEDEDVAETL